MSIGQDFSSSAQRTYLPLSKSTIMYRHLSFEEMVKRLPDLTTFVHKSAARKHGISKQDFKKEEKVIAALNSYMSQLVIKIRETNGACFVAENIQKKKFVGIFMGCAFEKSPNPRWKYYQGYPVGPKLFHKKILNSYKSAEIENNLKIFGMKLLTNDNYSGLVYVLFHDKENQNLSHKVETTKLDTELISKEEGYRTLVLETTPKNKITLLKIIYITKQILEIEDTNFRTSDVSMLKVLRQIEILELFDQLQSLYRNPHLREIFKNKISETKVDLQNLRDKYTATEPDSEIKSRIREYDEEVLNKLEKYRANLNVSDFQFRGTEKKHQCEAISDKCLPVIATLSTLQARNNL